MASFSSLLMPRFGAVCTVRVMFFWPITGGRVPRFHITIRPFALTLVGVTLALAKVPFAEIVSTTIVESDFTFPVLATWS